MCKQTITWQTAKVRFSNFQPQNILNGYLHESLFIRLIFDHWEKTKTNIFEEVCRVRSRIWNWMQVWIYVLKLCVYTIYESWEGPPWTIFYATFVPLVRYLTAWHHSRLTMHSKTRIHPHIQTNNKQTKAKKNIILLHYQTLDNKTKK